MGFFTGLFSHAGHEGTGVAEHNLPGQTSRPGGTNASSDGVTALDNSGGHASTTPEDPVSDSQLRGASVPSGTTVRSESDRGQNTWVNADRAGFGTASIITSAGGVGVAGYTVYNANQRVSQGEDMLGKGAHQVHEDAKAIAQGLGNHVPTESDITAAAAAAEHGAHNVAEGLSGPVAQNVLTIGAVLLAAVLVYEVSKAL